MRSGDTLWARPAERYGGDPREGVWRIRERNGLGRRLPAGCVLYLPAGVWCVGQCRRSAGRAGFGPGFPVAGAEFSRPLPHN